MQVWIGSKSPYFVEQNWLPYKHNVEYDDPNWDGKGGRWIHSLRGDWKPAYWDKTANQAFHSWFFTASRFFDAPPISFIGNIYHEKIEGDIEKDYDYINSPENVPPPPHQHSKPDYDLSLKAMELGAILEREWKFQNLIRPIECRTNIYSPLMFDPAGWILANYRN